MNPNGRLTWNNRDDTDARKHFEALQAAVDTEKARAEKAEQERDEAREARNLWVTRSDQWERAEQRAVEQRNAALSELADYEPRPLAPDDITYEMVERALAARDYNGQPYFTSDTEAHDLLAAALAEPPTRPDGAEELDGPVRTTLVGHGQAPDYETVKSIADALAERGVRVTGDES